MPYVVTAQHDGSDTSDIMIHDLMVSAVMDMVLIGRMEPDSWGPISWTIQWTDTIAEAETMKYGQPLGPMILEEDS